MVLEGEKGTGTFHVLTIPILSISTQYFRLLSKSKLNAKSVANGPYDRQTHIFTQRIKPLVKKKERQKRKNKNYIEGPGFVINYRSR